MRPKCPNHAVQMEPTNERRIWICPVSGYHFECDVETADRERKIVNGSVVEVLKVIPLDGQGG